MAKSKENKEMNVRMFALTSLLLVTALLIVIGCAKEKKTEPAGQTAEMNYVCPMHPEVVSKEPGLCPKCNMLLVHKDSLSAQPMNQAADTVKAVYTCPMHPEVVSDTAGICPKCNMQLELIETT